MKQINQLPIKPAPLSGAELVEIQDGGGVGSSKAVTTQEIANLAAPTAPGVAYTPAGTTGLVGVTEVQQALDAIGTAQAQWAAKWSLGYLTRQTITLLGAPGTSGVVQLARTCLLLKVAFSAPMRLRLYDTAANRVLDASRPAGQLPAQGSGLLFEGIADQNIQSWDTSPVPIIASGELVTTPNIAYTFEPTQGVSETPGNVQLTILVLEP